MSIVLLALAIAIPSAPLHADRSRPTARYQVAIRRPSPEQVEVEAWLPVRDGRLFMDSIQAQQLPRGWATFVRHLSIQDSAGHSLPFDTDSGASWTLRAPYQGLVHLSYAVDLAYARGAWPTGPKQSGRFFDETLYTVTKALFVVSGEVRDARVGFTLPEGWRISTPWDPVSGLPGQYIVDDATDLLRNAIVLGHQAELEVRDGRFTLLIALPGQIGASRALVEPAARRIVHEYTQLFRGTPPSRVLVTFFYADTEDGEAFWKAATLTTADSVTVNSRVIWGNFLAHEIFHHWNGQLIRGVDRSSRQYFSEGFTEYYANRTIVRAGLITPDVYLRKMETQIALYGYFRSASAFNGISLEQAGQDKTRYRFGVYQGGWTVALCLDGEIRKLTHDQKTLDDFTRRMFDEFADHPYRTSDLARVASEVAGPALSGFFSKYVAGTETLPYDRCLRSMGFEGFGKQYAAELYVFPRAAATPEEARRRADLTGVPIKTR